MLPAMLALALPFPDRPPLTDSIAHPVTLSSRKGAASWQVPSLTTPKSAPDPHRSTNLKEIVCLPLYKGGPPTTKQLLPSQSGFLLTVLLPCPPIQKKPRSVN